MTTTRGHNTDRRVVEAIAVTAIGAVFVLGAWYWTGDSLEEFVTVALYSMGWALLTFIALYVLAGRFDAMKWRRQDHDLEALFDAELSDPNSTRVEKDESQ